MLVGDIQDLNFEWERTEGRTDRWREKQTDRRTDRQGLTRTDKDWHGSTRTNTDQHGPTRTNMDQHGPTWTNTDQHGTTNGQTDWLTDQWTHRMSGQFQVSWVTYVIHKTKNLNEFFLLLLIYLLVYSCIDEGSCNYKGFCQDDGCVCNHGWQASDDCAGMFSI